MRQHFNVGSLVVIIITFILFIFALFTKGLTHELLLEAGIFLISVKLIMMAYKNSVCVNSMTYRLKPVDCYGRKRPLRLKSAKLQINPTEAQIYLDQLLQIHPRL